MADPETKVSAAKPAAKIFFILIIVPYADFSAQNGFHLTSELP